MEISKLLLIAFIVVVGFVLVNKMYYSNQKYDLEYRRKRAKQQQDQKPES